MAARESNGANGVSAVKLHSSSTPPSPSPAFKRVKYPFAGGRPEILLKNPEHTLSLEPGTFSTSGKHSHPLAMTHL